MTQQEPPAPESAAEVVAYLTDQHQHIARLLDDVGRDGGDRRRDAFTRFRRLLAVHEASEQEIVHPRATYELASGRPIVATRLDEEDELLQLVSSMEGQRIGSPEFERELDALRRRLTGHMRREEELELAGLRIQLGSRQLRRMSRAVRLAAGVEDPPAGQGESFAQMFDDACRAIRRADGDPA